MPLEIKELQIKVTVNDQQPKIVATPSTDPQRDEKKRMCRECIDEIMDILNSKKER